MLQTIKLPDKAYVIFYAVVMAQKNYLESVHYIEI